MLNVVHAFTGVDAQYMAEKKVWGEENINVLGSMEIDVDAIISCALIHENEKFHKYMKQEWDEEQYNQAREWLRKRNIGYDFSKEKSKLDKMRKEKLKQLYIASVCIKNYGDISLANNIKLKEDIDLFTYSSPCQSFSVMGNLKGLEGKSGLLLECEKFIRLNKPKVLLLENVKNLVGKKFKKDFDNWIKLLDELGYASYWDILDAKEFNIPQNRKRVFCISIRKDINKEFSFPTRLNLSKKLKDILEVDVDDKYNLKGVLDFFINNSFKMEKEGNGFRFRPHVLNNADTSICLTTKSGGRMDDNFIIDIESDKLMFEFSSKNEELYKYNKDLHKIRKLTPLKCWRLMGFSDSDFDKVQGYVSDTQLYKQAGNSIVVNCLEAIFNEIKNQGILI